MGLIEYALMSTIIARNVRNNAKYSYLQMFLWNKVTCKLIKKKEREKFFSQRLVLSSKNDIYVLA
jgi:hypothetical protein